MTFALEAQSSSTMVYVIRFTNQLTAVSGLEFLTSPGAIGMDNVDVIAIERSMFRLGWIKTVVCIILMLSVTRFFSKGAVDVYNSRTVLVQQTTFSHNILSSVVKDEAYRGHSAGLSIGEWASKHGAVGSSSLSFPPVPSLPLPTSVQPGI